MDNTALTAALTNLDDLEKRATRFDHEVDEFIDGLFSKLEGQSLQKQAQVLTLVLAATDEGLVKEAQGLTEGYEPGPYRPGRHVRSDTPNLGLLSPFARSDYYRQYMRRQTPVQEALSTAGYKPNILPLSQDVEPPSLEEYQSANAPASQPLWDRWNSFMAGKSLPTMTGRMGQRMLGGAGLGALGGAMYTGLQGQGQDEDKKKHWFRNMLLGSLVGGGAPWAWKVLQGLIKKRGM